ncbi:unnamed protein product [Citrullus colocynthis]|uniref:Uncharacterized protein n=1 Tax=Citrullus colocynthis TaxID=252529 RepID=A0ABP0XTT3_9ROSI
MTMARRLEDLLSHSRWIPPPQNSWKLISDVSWCEAFGCGGIGWVVRDSNRSSASAIPYWIWPLKRTWAYLFRWLLCN